MSMRMLRLADLQRMLHVGEAVVQHLKRPLVRQVHAPPVVVPRLVKFCKLAIFTLLFAVQLLEK